MYTLILVKCILAFMDYFHYSNVEAIKAIYKRIDSPACISEQNQNTLIIVYCPHNNGFLEYAGNKVILPNLPTLSGLLYIPVLRVGGSSPFRRATKDRHLQDACLLCFMDPFQKSY